MCWAASGTARLNAAVGKRETWTWRTAAEVGRGGRRLVVLPAGGAILGCLVCIHGVYRYFKTEFLKCNRLPSQARVAVEAC